jgi:uracil-DNA glycosylase
MPAPVFLKAPRLVNLYKKVANMHIATIDDGPTPAWEGNPDAPLVVIGSCHPEKQSLERSFMLRELEALNLTRSKVYITNAIKRPLLKKTGNVWVIDTRGATANEIDIFRPFLLDEIEIVNPAAVICLGGNPAKVLFGDMSFSVMKERGKVLSAPGVSAPVFVTVSPAYVLRTGGSNGFASRLFRSDLRLAHDEAFLNT